jgi:hypothetical protein
MIFNYEILCIGYVGLFQDAILMFANEKLRDVILESEGK